MTGPFAAVSSLLVVETKPMRTTTAALTLATCAILAQAASAADVESARAGGERREYEDVTARKIDSYVVRRGFTARTRSALEARRLIADMPPGLRAVSPIKNKTVVRGAVEVPVIAVTFSNTKANPYPVVDLERQLFDSAPHGTMTEHYAEMSRGALSVTGEVFEWARLSEADTFYAGSCNGLCNSSNMAQFVSDALAAADRTIDFSRFDNDGPDNVPNSDDDDGFVDFVALVHPESGGECATPNDNIWSHRFSLSQWTGNVFRTDDPGRNGVNVFIDDYVVMPALACDGATMIAIGVFSHEFGHAFGLPDLYDSKLPRESSGIGGWGLMASGSWGGDGENAPDRPTHMTAWSKEFLGWTSPRVIENDQNDVELRPITDGGNVVRVDYSDAADPDDARYLLLEYRKQEAFDSSLTGSGLLVTEVNNSRVQSGLVDNSVNAEPFDMGINVIEADGLRELDREKNRGDDADVFPGTSAVTHLDASHVENVRAALCDIRITPERVTLDIFTSRSTCPGMLPSARRASFDSPDRKASWAGDRCRRNPRESGRQSLH